MCGAGTSFVPIAEAAQLLERKQPTSSSPAVAGVAAAVAAGTEPYQHPPQRLTA